MKKKAGKFFSVFEGAKDNPPPIWLMRQAGRYLPEYRELRQKAGSFWAMCMNPDLAAAITLQPIRRFDFDGAVIFSDILVIPLAMGIKVMIEEGLGPRLPPIRSAGELMSDERVWRDATMPVYEALARVRSELALEKALIGFVGGPWTLATYLAQGQGSYDQRAAKLWGYRDAVSFDALLDVLADAAVRHLAGQIDAGADVVQIFDSWSAGLPFEAFVRWVIRPTKRIVDGLRKTHPSARVIGFPRATSLEGYRAYAAETGVDVVSVDTAAPIAWVARELGSKKIVQGNLDPIALIAGGAAQAAAVKTILDAMRDVPFIFNLGHGILQETPIAHVEQLVAQVRGA